MKRFGIWYSLWKKRMEADGRATLLPIGSFLTSTFERHICLRRVFNDIVIVEEKVCDLISLPGNEETASSNDFDDAADAEGSEFADSLSSHHPALFLTRDGEPFITPVTSDSEKMVNRLIPCHTVASIHNVDDVGIVFGRPGFMFRCQQSAQRKANCYHFRVRIVGVRNQFRNDRTYSVIQLYAEFFDRETGNAKFVWALVTHGIQSSRRFAW